MSQDSSPTTPAVRSTSHLSSLAGSRAAAMVFRLAPAQHSIKIWHGTAQQTADECEVTSSQCEDSC
jgi:hypothetical protein